MRWLLSVIGATVLASLVSLAAPVSAAPLSGHWQWPLTPRPVVVAGFRPPEQRWAPGHRGIDLLGAVGAPVSAVDAGTVSFAGVVAGRGVVVVDHGALRSTYEPVLAQVRRGDDVDAGQVVGTLEAVGSHCFPRVCLHLGARHGDEYVDPLTLLGPREVRLKPLGGSSPLSPGGEPAAGGTIPAPRPSAAASHGSTTTHDLRLAGTAALATTAAIATAAAGRARRRRRTGFRAARGGPG
jgi:murein DD-endopeptidase MepM/ murein hydrolase activator NlpD